MRAFAVLLVVLAACNKTPPSAGTGSPPPALDGLLGGIVNSDLAHGVATGHFESTGETGKWVVEHARCYSGDLDGFSGATVENTADDGIHFRFIQDPIKGWALKVNDADTCKGDHPPKCLAHLFGPENCRKLDVALTTRLGKRYKWYSGDIEVDCSDESAHVFGKLKLDGCRN